MTCVWCLKTLALKMITPHFHKWKTNILIMKSHDNSNTTTAATTTVTTTATATATATTTYDDDNINAKSPVLSKAYELMERLQKTGIYNSPIDNNDINSNRQSSQHHYILSASKEVEQKREDLLTKARMLIDSVNKNVINNHSNTNSNNHNSTTYNNSNSNATSSNTHSNNIDSNNSDNGTKNWQDILDKFNIGKKANDARSRARSHSPLGLRSKSPSFMGSTVSYQNKNRYDNNIDDNSSRHSKSTLKSQASNSNTKYSNQYHDYDDGVTAEWKAWSKNVNGNTNENTNTNNIASIERGRRPSGTPSYLLPTRASLGSHSMIAFTAPSSINSNARRARSTTPTNTRHNNNHDTNATSTIKPRPLNMDLAVEPNNTNTNTKPLRSRSTTPTSVSSRPSQPKMEKAQLELLFGHLIENKSQKQWSQQLRR